MRSFHFCKYNMLWPAANVRVCVSICLVLHFCCRSTYTAGVTAYDFPGSSLRRLSMADCPLHWHNAIPCILSSLVNACNSCISMELGQCPLLPTHNPGNEARGRDATNRAGEIRYPSSSQPTRDTAVIGGIDLFSVASPVHAPRNLTTS